MQRRHSAFLIIIACCILAQSTCTRIRKRIKSKAPDPSPVRFVFVKRWDISAFTTLAYHTEVALCVMYPTKLGKPEFNDWADTMKRTHKEEWDKLDMMTKKQMHQQLPTYFESMKENLDAKFFNRSMGNDAASLNEFFEHCYITGFQGVRGGWRLFDDPRPVFYQGPTFNQKPAIFYAGHVVLNHQDFLNRMSACGSWGQNRMGQRDYSLLKQNCNSYTETVLKALHLEIQDQEAIKKSSLEVPRLTDFGRWDIHRGHCVGIKCTALDQESSDCVEATCHDPEGIQPSRFEFDVETKSCVLRDV